MENELLASFVLHGLEAVSALKRGRTEARESDPVVPVARSVVEATLPHMQSVVGDMVCLQLETGMRPGELVTMRGCDIDMSGKTWLYRPSRHKTEHHGHTRVVPIGPRGQAIVRRHLKTDIQAFLFSPAETMAGRARSSARIDASGGLQTSRSSGWAGGAYLHACLPAWPAQNMEACHGEAFAVEPGD